jgi:hypothetical protein
MYPGRGGSGGRERSARSGVEGWEGVPCVHSKEKRSPLRCVGGAGVYREEECTRKHCTCATIDGCTGGGLREAEGARVQHRGWWALLPVCLYLSMIMLASCLGVLFEGCAGVGRGRGVLAFACAGRVEGMCRAA